MRDRSQSRPINAREQPVRAQSGEFPVGRLVLGRDLPSRSQDAIPPLAHQGSHLVDTPGQIDGGGASQPNSVHCVSHLDLGPAAPRALVHGQDHAHGAGYSQGWRPADRSATTPARSRRPGV